MRGLWITLRILGLAWAAFYCAMGVYHTSYWSVLFQGLHPAHAIRTGMLATLCCIGGTLIFVALIYFTLRILQVVPESRAVQRLRTWNAALLIASFVFFAPFAGVGFRRGRAETRYIIVRIQKKHFWMGLIEQPPEKENDANGEKVIIPGGASESAEDAAGDILLYHSASAAVDLVLALSPLLIGAFYRLSQRRQRHVVDAP